MDTISGYLGADHTRCDNLFAQLEACVGAGKWNQADSDLERFDQSLERHFGMEEDILFPAFEQATNSTAGPTAMMRKEHALIREIVSRVARAIDLRDANDFFDHADTLRIMTQQHNLKEEGILYGMTDRILAGRQDEIIEAMRAVTGLGASSISNLVA